MAMMMVTVVVSMTTASLIVAVNVNVDVAEVMSMLEFDNIASFADNSACVSI